MNCIDLEKRGLVCTSLQECASVKGGIAVECADNLWDYVKQAFDFIVEYRNEIIEGFKRGWGKF